MEISGAGKTPNTSLSFRYNANNEELEELFDACEDDPPTPQFDASPSVRSENASPKRGDKTPSILDKYFKSIRAEKVIEKLEDVKPIEPKAAEEGRSPPKDVTCSPMKEYLNRLGKRSTPEVPDVKEGIKEGVKEGGKEGTNETWKLFHDFKYKIAQAVEDMKTRSLEDSTKEKSIPRDNSISDSEENSAIKDLDQSVGDTDNQVSSLESSIQNLSEMTQPLTAKPADRESSLPLDSKNHSDSSDDTHKNLVHSDLADLTRDLINNANLLEVESGVEALEDGIEGFGDASQMDLSNPSNKPIDNVPIKTPLMPVNFNLPPSKSNLETLESTKPMHFLNFTMYFLTFLLFLNYVLFPKSHIWNGFFLGIWFFCFVNNLKQYVLDNFFSEWEPSKTSLFQLKKSSSMPPTYTIPSVKEHRPIKKYEGWINHYRFPEYDPLTYHINKTTTAFMKLEGSNLRISYTKTKIAKRSLWDEKLEKVVFYQHRLYNLTGAKVMILPKGLVKRRQWAKKYPICVILNEKEKIQILEKESACSERRASEFTAEKKKEQQFQQEMESTETNTSPEKRKKFVWRRRDKSVPHAEAEVGKEGLRHRLVRKMHRDKKTDSVSTSTETMHCQNQDKNQQMEEASFHDAEMDLATKSVTSTKDDADEELDENEFSRIKEFLEEAELDADPEGHVEGEWSLHVKHSKDNHSQLFLFARTGRDKLEWYRRLMGAIAGAKPTMAAAESSAADDKSSSEPSPDGKEGIEMAVYKLSEKEHIAFAKGTGRPDSIEGASVTIAPPKANILNTLENYEKTFWPYLIKIIEQKSPSPSCQCRMLPAEVTWLNTMLARVIYDVTRDPLISARLQARIQRKLHTLKMPSFMSPLVVTELSLAGACPLVERVSAPTWDERGVWFDADLRYEGGAYITVLTQINLMKLKEKNITLEEQILNAAENLENEVKDSTAKVISSEQSIIKQGKPAAYDSEVEDSAESSSDDETPLVQPVDSGENLPHTESGLSTDAPASSKKKFLRMVDKIATNKYFQQVTDYKYVKRAMEGLSNTDIKLQLEVHGLEGRLAINLPPPPHDRLWIGFRTNPQLILKARPAVGARSLRFAHISNWIEQKLSKEFEKVLVLPNMEDFVIGAMTPTPIEYH